MRRDITIVLDVAIEALEEQKASPDPEKGVTGHLLYLVESLAYARLTKKEQQRVQHILTLYQECAYGPSVARIYERSRQETPERSKHGRCGGASLLAPL